MNLEVWKNSIGKRLQAATLCALPLLMCSCASAGKNTNISVLTESEVYLIVPAGVPFKAKECKECPLKDYIRKSDAWVVDAGRLAKLQEELNKYVTQK